MVLTFYLRYLIKNFASELKSWIWKLTSCFTYYRYKVNLAVLGDVYRYSCYASKVGRRMGFSYIPEEVCWIILSVEWSEWQSLLLLLSTPWKPHMSWCEALVTRGFDWMGVVKACRLGSDSYQLKLLGVEEGWAGRGIADVATHAGRFPWVLVYIPHQYTLSFIKFNTQSVREGWGKASKGLENRYVLGRVRYI